MLKKLEGSAMRHKQTINKEANKLMHTPTHTHTHVRARQSAMLQLACFKGNK